MPLMIALAVNLPCLTLLCPMNIETLPRGPSRLLLSLALWFGIVTGLVEGAGLLLFQRINWAPWGRWYTWPSHRSR